MSALKGVIRQAAAASDPATARAILAQAIEGTSADLARAAAAFERDMRPVREAIVSALKAGDMEALRGLRAMLPHLLAEVNRSPALADVLAFQLGKSLVTGLTAKPEDVV